MALVFMDSFDHYQTADITKKWSTVDPNVTITTGGRTGNRMYFPSPGDYVRKAVPAAATYIVGAAMRAGALDSTTNILTFSSASNQECGVVLHADGSLSLKRGPTLAGAATGGFDTTLATSASGVITAASWYYVEVTATLDGSAGAMEVLVNGVSVVSVSGADTNYTSATEITTVDFGTMQASGGSHIDDVYICDTSGSTNNDFLGDVTCEAVFPSTGNGSNADFTCSTGTDHGALVDEAATDYPNEDTDYVYSSTSGHRDTFNYPNITPSDATIHGVQVCICAKKTDTGTRTYTDVAKLSGGSNDDGSATVAPSDTSYAYGLFVRETKPGGGAWTVSDVNGAEFGVKVAS